MGGAEGMGDGPGLMWLANGPWNMALKTGLLSVRTQEWAGIRSTSGSSPTRNTTSLLASDPDTAEGLKQKSILILEYGFHEITWNKNLALHVLDILIHRLLLIATTFLSEFSGIVDILCWPQNCFKAQCQRTWRKINNHFETGWNDVNSRDNCPLECRTRLAYQQKMKFATEGRSMQWVTCHTPHTN